MTVDCIKEHDKKVIYMPTNNDLTKLNAGCIPSLVTEIEKIKKTQGAFNLKRFPTLQLTYHLYEGKTYFKIKIDDIKLYAKKITTGWQWIKKDSEILAKKISENVSGIAMTAWLGVFAGPQLIFLSFIIEGNTYTYIISANKEAWLIVLYLGFVMNALGYSIWYFLLGKHPVHKIIPVLLLLPVVGVICAVLILGENLFPLN